jgi:proteasome regulatory subunit
MEETATSNTAPASELKYQIQLNELEASLLEMKVKVDELTKENGQLKRENNQLKRMPLLSLTFSRTGRSTSASRATTRNT